jgi:hypothetical protein
MSHANSTDTSKNCRACMAVNLLDVLLLFNEQLVLC